MAKSLFLPSGRPINYESPPMDGGAEGLVLGIDGQPGICLKVYTKDKPDTHDRLSAMLELPPRRWGGDRPDHIHMAWPAELVCDESGRTVGFIQSRLSTATSGPIAKLFNPHDRAALLHNPTWLQMLIVARRSARLVAMLHQEEIVIGDLSHQNSWVNRDAHVTLIDCDSMQFVDPRNGRLYPATRTTRDYNAPELLGANPVAPSERSDRFALGIMICQLLMEGHHPFEGVPADGSQHEGYEFNIRMQNNRITHPERLKPYPAVPKRELLPPAIRELAERCFGAGHSDPDRRPTAEEWRSALARAESEVIGCQESRYHLYPRSLPRCIWCERKLAGLGDNYPEPRRAGTPASPPGPAPRPAPGLPAQPTLPAPTPIHTPDNVPEPDQSPPSTGTRIAAWIAAAIVAYFVIMIIIGFLQ